MNIDDRLGLGSEHQNLLRDRNFLGRADSSEDNGTLTKLRFDSPEFVVKTRSVL